MLSKRRVSSLALILLQLSFAMSQAGQRTETLECPTAFFWFRQQYLSCTPDVWHGGEEPLMRSQTLTGQTLVSTLNDFCSRLPSYRDCFFDQYQGCPDSLLEVTKDAVDRPSWICDDDGNVRSSVVDALTSSNASVPVSETIVSSCSTHVMADVCVRDTLGQEKYTRLRRFSANGRLQLSISDVFDDPVMTQYFYDLFDCNYQNMKKKCPHNALVMTLAESSHFLFPPKFGINVSDIILQTVAS